MPTDHLLLTKNLGRSLTDDELDANLEYLQGTIPASAQNALDAATSAVQAVAAKQVVVPAAAAAAVSASSAASSAATATTHAAEISANIDTASSAATTAVAAQTVAVTARTAAEAAQAQSATSASSAVAAALAAAASAVEAAGSSVSAGVSAGTATTQATNAGASATAAAGSSTAAAGSATTANAQAGIATTKAGEASASATAAAGSAASAATAKTAAETARDVAVAAAVDIARVSRLRAVNNAGTSTSIMDIACGSAVLTDASNHAVVWGATAAISCNITTQGANGRDQAGAFANSAHVHFFYIWNGTTKATLASLSSTNPTLPSGYTHKAYAFSVVLTAGGVMYLIEAYGNRVVYRGGFQLLGTPTSTTTGAFRQFVPDIADTWTIAGQINANASGGGNCYCILSVGVSNVTATHALSQIGLAGVAGSLSGAWGFREMPNGSMGSIDIDIYIPDATSVTTVLHCIGYTVPNS